jgi:hypothetical protein
MRSFLTLRFWRRNSLAVSRLSKVEPFEPNLLAALKVWREARLKRVNKTKEKAERETPE